MQDSIKSVLNNGQLSGCFRRFIIGTNFKVYRNKNNYEQNHQQSEIAKFTLVNSHLFLSWISYPGSRKKYVYQLKRSISRLRISIKVCCRYS